MITRVTLGTPGERQTFRDWILIVGCLSVNCCYDNMTANLTTDNGQWKGDMCAHGLILVRCPTRSYSE